MISRSFESLGVMIYAYESESPEMFEVGGTSGHPDQPAGFTANGSAPAKVNIRHLGREDRSLWAATPV